MFRTLMVVVCQACTFLLLSVAATGAGGLAHCAPPPMEDTAVITADSTRVMLGEKTLHILGKGTTVQVVAAQGSWVNVKFKTDGGNVSGWVRDSDLKRVASQAPPKTKKKSQPPQKKIPDAEESRQRDGQTQETLEDEFRRMLAEKGREITNVSSKPKTEATKAIPPKPAADPPKIRAPSEVVSSGDRITVQKKQAVPTANIDSRKVASKQAPPLADTADSAGRSEISTSEKVRPPEITKPETDNGATPVANAQTENDIGVEGPEALAEKFSQILAQRRQQGDPEISTSEKVRPPEITKPEADSGATPVANAQTGNDIDAEGPEALAEKFSQILAQRRQQGDPEISTSENVIPPEITKPEADNGATPVANAQTGNDIDAEGPEALAEKFSQILAQRRQQGSDTVPEMTVTDEVLVVRNAADFARLEPTQRIGQLTVTGDQVTNRLLKRLAGLTVASLSIEAVNVSNAGVQAITEIHGIQRLHLWSPGINDDALEFVAALKDLQVLDVEGTTITGTKISFLEELSKLQLLTLGSQVTDDSIAELKQLSALRRLDLRACRELSEECLADLANLKSLEVIWLPFQLRDEGKTTLRAALPDCQIRN